MQRWKDRRQRRTVSRQGRPDGRIEASNRLKDKSSRQKDRTTTRGETKGSEAKSK